MSHVVFGCGYIGSELCRQLLEAGEQVVGLDNLFSTDADAIRRLSRFPGWRFIQGSVSSRSDVEMAFLAADPRPIVYNLAAQASADPSVATSEYTEEVNLRGPRLVVETAVKQRARSIVYGSSTRVYGRSLPAIVSEQTEYGSFQDLAHLSKVYGEKLHEMHALSGSVPAVSARIGLVYGPSPVMKTDPRFMTAPNKFCLQALRGQTLSVTDDSVVAAIDVRDAACALRILGGANAGEQYRAVNVATEVLSIGQMARQVAASASRRGKEVSLSLPSSPRQESVMPTLSSSLSGLGFSPLHTYSESVEQILECFQPIAK